MNDKEYSTKGSHYLADFWGVDYEDLCNTHYLMTILKDAVNLSGATIVDQVHEQFIPSGCTILLLLSESHASIHTYPDRAYAAIDIYTCGDVDPSVSINYLKRELLPTNVRIHHFIRGVR